MQRHRRPKQTISLKERLASFAKDIREKALRLPPGTERDALLEKAKKADAATHLDDWVNSLGLQPPK